MSSTTNLLLNAARASAPYIIAGNSSILIQSSVGAKKTFMEGVSLFFTSTLLYGFCHHVTYLKLPKDVRASLPLPLEYTIIAAVATLIFAHAIKYKYIQFSPAWKQYTVIKALEYAAENVDKMILIAGLIEGLANLYYGDRTYGTAMTALIGIAALV